MNCRVWVVSWRCPHLICSGSGFRFIGWDRQPRALLDVVDVLRYRISPLLTAHIAGEFLAKFIDPEIRPRPDAYGVVATARDDVLAVRAEGDAVNSTLMSLERLADGLRRSRRPRGAGSCPHCPRRCACRPG